MRKTIFLFAALGAMLLALVVSTRGIAEDYNPPPEWGHPAPGRSVTAWFGADNSGVGAESSHSGIDFGTASSPKAKILATGDGLVQIVENGGLLFQGTTIVIFHGWDTEGNCVSTLYAHNRNPRVQTGQVVSVGETIATAYGFQPPNGSPFQWHLHYSYLRACPGEYRYGDFVNPEKLPTIATRWDGQPPQEAQNSSMDDLLKVEWQVQGRDLFEVEFTPVETEEIASIRESEQQTSEQLNSGNSANTNLILVGGLFLMFLIGAALLANGKTWPMGLMILLVVGFGVFILLNSSQDQVEITPQQSTQELTVNIPDQPRQMELPEELLALLEEEVKFPDLPQEEEGDCEVSQKFPNKILRWCNLITHFATKNGLEPNLVAALILQESGGNPIAYSKSGAVGLMQVMPRDGIAASFSCVNGPCFANRPSITQLEDPQFNVKYGSRMLSGLVSKYGDIREALKYYGPSNVGYYYADIVIGIHNRYK